MIDYYKYLMIKRDSDTQTIKSAIEMAYQRLRQRGQTDEEVLALRQAEEIFFDPIKKAAYDANLSAEESTGKGNRPKDEKNRKKPGIKIDYYDYFRVNPYSDHETVQKALDMAYQDLQRRGGTQEEYKILREAKDTLLNPMNRNEYDQSREISLSDSKKSNKAEVKNGSGHFDKYFMGISAALLLFLVVILIFFWGGRIKGSAKPAINPGVYLVETSNDSESAVLRKFDPAHRFPDGKEGKGYEIMILDSKETAWISEEDLLSRYTAGKYAPRELTGN